MGIIAFIFNWGADQLLSIKLKSKPPYAKIYKNFIYMLVNSKGKGVGGGVRGGG